VLLLLLPAVVHAQNAYSTNADGSNYTYSTNADGSANIVTYAGPPWVVTIPTNINGLTVTSIGTNAFEYENRLTSVTMPNSVTSIGDSAFADCQRLTGVPIPGSVTSIGAYAFFQCSSLTNATIDSGDIGEQAFYECYSLTSVTIDNGVTSIGEAAFVFCDRLTNITIPASVTNMFDAFGSCANLTAITVDTNNPVYSSLNGVVFDKRQGTLIQYPGGLGGSYTIPNSVTSIGGVAFAGCASLTNVMIPNSVTTMGEGAFVECTSLTSVTIPRSVTSIANSAFSGCTSLKSVTIPDSVTSIASYAFVDCISLTNVYFTSNAPSPIYDSTVFSYDPATVYYLPGTTGWGATFDGLPTALWFLPNPQVLIHSVGFGVQPGGFGFTISWATNGSVVVEAATNLANPIWIPVSTNTLTGGTNHFSDPEWTNFPSRFYRAQLSPAYTVGGTLTGLPAGDTVTLQDNGPDNLTLSTNGTFTFPTALPNGHAYSVTVSGTSGGTPTTCTVTANGSGTISGANVTNVAVQCISAPTCPELTGIMDEDMYNAAVAAVADGTANGGVPAVMFTTVGGPFRVTAVGICSENVCHTYAPWCWFDHTVGSN